VNATRLLSAWAMVGSEPRAVPICPPLVEYSSKFQAKAADELGLLPARLGIAEMLGDYAVMRDHARVCRRPG
jgi:hypothetical protein